MAGSAITAAAASRTFFIQYLLVEEFQRGASRRADQMRKQANSTRRLLHSPPNGACFDALLPKCGPDVTVPQLEPRNSAFEGDFYQFLHYDFRNFQSFLPGLWARSRRR